MKDYIYKLLHFFANFFRVTTNESSARLYSFMIILSGCFMAVWFNFMYCYKLYPRINGGEYAIIMGSIAAYIGVGVYGKIQTGKNESNVVITENNKELKTEINPKQDVTEIIK